MYNDLVDATLSNIGKYKKIMYTVQVSGDQLKIEQDTDIGREKILA